MIVLFTALDVVQTAGLEPAHTSWRGALPTELRLQMSRFGHIVERCEGSYAQPELHRGVKGKYQLPETSCFYRPQLIFYEQGQRRITRKRSLPWRRRRGLHLLHRNGITKAPLFWLSYVCI